MKYFGKKSLSSVLSTFFHISWYVVLIVTILATIAGAILLFSTPARDFISSEMAKKEQMVISANNNDCWKTFECSSTSSDRKDWEKFKNMPILLRLIALPYVWIISVLLLQIIKKSRLLFANFKKDIVFNQSNVNIISQINKLLIAFSILTFNFSSLFVCVLLLMICEIFKNGAVLQEEHDLTV